MKTITIPPNSGTWAAAIGVAMFAGSALAPHVTFSQRIDPGQEPPRLAPAIAQLPIGPPLLLTARDMARLPRLNTRQVVELLTPQDLDHISCRDCLDAGTDPNEAPAGVPRTPRPTTQFAETTLGFTDPQIAASSTHLIVTTTGTIAFYEKSGKLLGPKSGMSLTNPMSTRNFFKPFWEDPANSINNGLNLPPTVAPLCDPADPFADGTFCINSYYDTRVMFDPHRKRFFLGALAINRNSKIKDLVCGSGDDANRRGSRRTKFLLAISATEDPRDGWWMWGFNAVPGDGDCNNPSGCQGSPFLPGDAGDYPSMGIDQDLFFLTTFVARRNPEAATCDEFADPSSRYTHMLVVDPGPLANGMPSPTAFQMWNIPDPLSGATVTSMIQPALHHTPGANSPNGRRHFFVSTAGSDDYIAWSLTLGNPVNIPASVQFTGSVVKATEWAGPINAPQRTLPPFYDPTDRIKMTNLATWPLKAVYRDGLLHSTWFTSKLWGGASEPLDSIRLHRVFVDAFPALPTLPGWRDRTFGLRNMFDDGPNFFVHYGWPSLEVNRDGHVAVGYIRTSSDIYPEARYSVWLSGEPDLRPSQLLKVGEMPYVRTSAEDPAAGVAQIDLTGTSVDPFDDEAIWMVAPYAFAPCSLLTPGCSPAGNMGLAVGKVFGRRVVDLTIATLQLQPPLTVPPGGALQVSFSIRNQGDGGATASHARVLLVGMAQVPFKAELFNGGIGALTSGSQISLTLAAVIPPNTPAGKYRIVAIADSDQQLTEYSESNNELWTEEIVTVSQTQRHWHRNERNP